MTVSEIRALFAVANRPEVVSLAGGMPYLSALPLDVVGDLVGKLIRDQGANALQYGAGQGELALRERICEVMALEKISASAGDVVVTVGSQHGLTLLAQAFLDPGDVVLAEGPSYVGALGVFAAAQAEVTHVPMDADGLDPAALADALATLRAQGKRAKFVYTVPNFHNPAGVTMTEERRDALVALAQQYDVLIIEDNPYGLLGFEDEPGRALRSRDSDRVIYLGSFSKTFAPGLRTGWVLAPPAVRQKLVLINEAQVLCPPQLTQRVITEYLTHHPWRQQIKVFRELYQTRRDAMLSALNTMMPSGVSWEEPRGGFYIWLTLPEGIDSKSLLARALAHQVAYVPGVGFYSDGQGRGNLRLSYCFPEPERLVEGVRRFSSALEQERALRSVFDGDVR
ncbi:MAG: PLP-dependent aminotransferase family protein [Corynebacteriales bacterium]|nr:PLP-dependent aminotransferase family protein [Mycobacteriales bacterium]